MGLKMSRPTAKRASPHSRAANIDPQRLRRYGPAAGDFIAGDSEQHPTA